MELPMNTNENEKFSITMARELFFLSKGDLVETNIEKLNNTKVTMHLSVWVLLDLNDLQEKRIASLW